MANLQNLKPFKKGQSGNPKGKPVGTFSLTKAVKEFLLERHKDGKTYGDKLKEATVVRAIVKSDTLVKEIWERTDGKLAETVNLRTTKIDGKAQEIANRYEAELDSLQLKEAEKLDDKGKGDRESINSSTSPRTEDNN